VRERIRGCVSKRPQPTTRGWPAQSAIVSAGWSVSRVLSHSAFRRRGDGHPSGAVGHPTAHAADPRAGQRTSPPPTVSRPRVAPSYLALLRVEFARFTPNTGSRRRSASSLWHWSSPCGGRALPATLRWGARTFLTPLTGHPAPTRGHPTASLTDRYYCRTRGMTASARAQPPSVWASDAAAGAERCKGAVRSPDDAPRSRAHPAPHDRSPRWQARRRPNSGRAARASRSTARSRPGSVGRPSRAGSAWRP
jgi:hypothetical protein